MIISYPNSKKVGIPSEIVQRAKELEYSIKRPYEPSKECFSPRLFGFVLILSILKHTFAYEKVERSLKRLMAK